MRNNNFDILRLVCALLVIVSHSYALVGLKGDEPLWRQTSTIIASDLGLCGFFTISGYLILNSLMNSKNILSYLGKRCLRIFPGLLVCLILVVIACSFFYESNPSLVLGYWQRKATYSFIWNNLGLYTIQWDIPGVFEHNVMATVDGSLWTLAHEFTMYLLIIVLFFLRDNKKWITILAMAALLLCLTKNVVFTHKLVNRDICNLNVSHFAMFAQYFVTGMLLLNRKYWRTDKVRWIVVSLCACTCVILMILRHTYIHTSVNITPIIMLGVSVMFIMLGEMYWQPVSDGLKRIGDMSYGVYIYSFPIQQMLIASVPGITPRMVIVLTIVAVLPIAYASWHLIEKRALALKKRL